MELYQFLIAITFVYFINIFNFFLLIFSGLMIKHFYKKKITNYEIKGTNKGLVKIFKYPKLVHDKLISYEYDNIIFKSIFYCYDKINNIYNICIDEVLIMFSELFYDIVNEHMEKNTNNIQNPNFVGFFNKNPTALNNMFINMLDKMPEPYKIQNNSNKNLNLKSSSILDDIKKFNNLDTSVIQSNKLTKNKMIDNISDKDINKFIKEDYMASKEKMSDKEVDTILDEELENLFKEQKDLNTLKENLQKLTTKFNNVQEQTL